MYLTNDYKDILEIFNEYEVRYLVVGAFAMAKLGYSRATFDIDLWVEKTKENALKISKALDEFGVAFEFEPDDFLEQNCVVQIGNNPNRIDILTDIDGVVFDEAWQNKNEADFDGLKAYCLSLDDLIINKSSSKREKDKLDLAQLRELAKVLE